ncbi:MAG: PEP-CTERM sorting domain-containing protein [Phycisphaerae bacterium]
MKFETSGSNLIVTLTNTSASDVLVPADVLTGVFWDVSGSPISLTRTSAVVPGTSSVLFGVTDPGGVVGGEWAYRGNIADNPPGHAYGISSAGLDIFGPGDRFPGNDLQGPPSGSPDGLQYGITSAGDNPATGNGEVTGSDALIKNQVVFTLAGLPSGFDPMARIGGIRFQYGTGLNEPHFPEPATLGLLAIGLVPALARRIRR